MSDPLSVSASIAGVIALADLTFKLVYKYARGVKDAKGDIESLADEINGLSSVLRTLEAIAGVLESEGDAFDPSLRLHYLHHCRKTLDKIEKRVRVGINRLAKSKISAVAMQLKWPFSSSETQNLLTELARHKETITMALSADTMQKLQLSLAKIEDLGKKVSSIAEVARRIEINTVIAVKNEEQRVLDYFVKISPQPYFQSSIKLRHAMTGLWLTDLPEFRHWLETPNSRLWLTGIPGAGKTVLAGSVIQEALERAFHESSVSVAFFFCDYKNADTWEPVNILGAIAAQLARQKEEAFVILKDYYETLHPATGLARPPDPDDLRAKITEMSELFDQTIVVLDGLDECGDKIDIVIDLLLELGDYTEKLTIAVFSRDHQEIRQRLDEYYESISIEAQTEDIKLYVASEIERRVQSRRLRLADMAMKDEILETLVTRAKGMFRWVVCQIDYLCDCAHDQERREALYKLPPNLPESYRRLLERINKCSPAVQTLVQMCLQFIAIDGPKLTITQLRQAISTPENFGVFLHESNTVSEDEITRRCSSLIRKSEDGLFFEFAHFSVQEFLEDHDALTKHKGKSDIKKYLVSRTSAHTHLAAQCLRFLQLKNFERMPQDTDEEMSQISERNQTYPFYTYAAINWLRSTAHVHSYDAVILKLSQSLFEPQKTPWFCSWALEVLDIVMRESLGSNFRQTLPRCAIEVVMDPDFRPLHMAAALSLPQVCTSILNQGIAVSVRCGRARPIDLAIVTILGIPEFDLASNGYLLAKYIADYPAFLKNTERRSATIECLVERGAKASNHRLDEDEFSIFSISCILLVELQDFNAILKLLESGFIPNQTEVGNFTESVNRLLARCEESITLEPNIESYTLKILDFIRVVTSEGAEWSLEISSTLWHFAIALDFSFTQLDFIVDARITMSIETLTARTVASVRNNELEIVKQCLADGRIDAKVYFDKDENTLLHIAVQHAAFDILEYLLNMGCDPNRENSVGRLPVQISAYGDFRQAFDIFGKRGILFVSSSDGSNICHTWADDDGWAHDALDVLYKIDTQATSEALVKQDVYHRTPLSYLLCNISDLSQQKLFHLLDLCPRIPNFWESQEDVFEYAARRGSAEVINNLLRASAIPEAAENNSCTPLHCLSTIASLDCVQILLKYYGQTRNYIYRGLLPVEQYIVECFSYKTVPNLDIVEALFPTTLAGIRDGKTWSSWQFICAMQYHVRNFGRKGSNNESDIDTVGLYQWGDKFDYIIPTYLKLGATQAYEEQHQESAVLPLFSSLLEYPGIDDLKPTEWLSVVTLSKVLDQTKWLTSAKSSKETINYFKRAITDLNLEVLQLFLERGVCIHQRTNEEESLVEYAFTGFRALMLCATEKGCGFLQKLLDHSGNRELRENSPCGLGLSLLHRIATDEDATSILWLVKALIQRGANVNGTGRDENNLVLVHHLRASSYQCAELLLDLGADPGLSIPGLLGAAQVVIMKDNVAFLKKILEHTRRTSTTIDWKKKGAYHFRSNKYMIDAQGANDLHWASIGAISCFNFYLAEGLLTIEESVSREGFTPQHINAFSGSIEMTKNLLAQGLDISAKDKMGRTPLHHAVIGNSLPKVQVLIEHGARELCDAFGETPRTYASRLGYTDIFEWLRFHSNHVDEELLNGILPNHDLSKVEARKRFQYAAENLIIIGDINSLEDMFTTSQQSDWFLHGDNGSTLLFLAINKSKLGIAAWLVSQGVNVLKAENGLSMLEKVAGTAGFASLLPMFLDAYWSQGGNLFVDNDFPLHHALSSRNFQNFPVLLDHLIRKIEFISNIVKSELSPSEAIKEILDRQDFVRGRSTVLHIAAFNGNLEFASLLVERGASVNSYDIAGKTPLSRTSDATMAEYLISMGASTTCFAIESDLELLGGIRIGPVSEELSRVFFKHRHVSSQLQTSPERLPIICKDLDLSYFRIEKMLQHGVDLLSEDEGGRSLMHQAICLETSLDFVLDHKLELSKLTPFPWHMNWRPIGMMAFLRSRFKDFSKALPRDLLCKVLNLESERGRSPLCQAAAIDAVDIIENCLSVGADIDFEGCRLGSALMAASACGNLEAVKFLISRNASTHYVGANGPRDCLTLAGTDEIRKWLLVGRFTGRLAIRGGGNSSGLAADEPRVKTWGGIVQARLLLCGKRGRMYNESSINYAKRLSEIRREWGGKVAPIGKYGLSYPTYLR
ncbi:hypothetical protein M426DRAFT_130023 [Hypoxylon sp. CI-4A]|nr:hypothetical protein M426DRAFT_130023 [Hypoxylon sp. CI-4A]